ncbi:ATP-binding protein [Pontibacter diazotrophicus]|uniref:ATP-binding protein n=1 Tax=Pontibacter diazotrophicus TaxID=1400979 RepID=A0A3D8L3H3_9BACT|nr:ATP-binding protein [Pontibacter diazotrophicus]RDV11863.1 ATP-binding protein [Pontibacter diazotrophicus]
MANINPGVHPHIDLTTAGFFRSEKHLVWQLKHVWFITFAKYQNFKGSDYSFVFVRPTDKVQESFRLEREILVLMSRYDNFDSRTLDFVDKLMFEFHNRLDKLCFILISNDKNIQEKVKDITIREPESRIIIPYHYDEFFKEDSQEVIWKRLKEQFYGRDLYSFESPLHNDTYFFGRNEFVHFYYDKYRTGENSGLFGLRKIGKTSVLYALERQLSARDEFSIYIDCQDPSLHKRKWNEALQFIIQAISLKLKAKNNFDIELENDYSEKNASISFATDLKKVYNKIGRKRILLIFDEIENLTFSLSPTEHWKSGEDYISFWQAIRSCYQAHNNIFSFLIAGVNPKIVETPTVNGFDNPIYRMITPKYLTFFTYDQVKEMVETIGNYMGINYDDEIYTFLTEEYGGHPFLIRQVCSLIHNDLSKDRPIKATKYFYKSNKENFDRRLIDYVDLIIQVLRNWYPEEYTLLEKVALDERISNSYSTKQEILIQHLLGYNLIVEDNGNFYIQINVIKEFLKQKTKLIPTQISLADKWKTIAEKRGFAERKLRELVKLNLKIQFGATKGRSEFLQIIDSSSSRYQRLSAISIEEIFSGEHELYFEDLRKFILKKWELFEKVFIDKQLFDIYLNLINRHRADAHAKEIDNDVYQSVMIAIDWLNDKLDEVLD